jgi:hypothetical protein
VKGALILYTVCPCGVVVVVIVVVDVCVCACVCVGIGGVTKKPWPIDPSRSARWCHLQ